MKTVKILLAASVLMAGAATAAPFHQISSSANVNIKIENGVATLWGNVDSSFDRAQAGRAAAKLEGVKKVRNLLSFSN